MQRVNILASVVAFSVALAAAIFVELYTFTVKASLKKSTNGLVEIYFSENRQFNARDRIALKYLENDGVYSGRISANFVTNYIRLDIGNSVGQAEISEIRVSSLFFDAIYRGISILEHVFDRHHLQIDVSDPSLLILTSSGDDPFLAIALDDRSIHGVQKIFWLSRIILFSIVFVFLFFYLSSLFSSIKKYRNIRSAIYGTSFIFVRDFVFVVGFLLFSIYLVNYVQLHGNWNISSYKNISVSDGVGSAVPTEVVKIKKLARQFGISTFYLSGDLGQGLEHNVIYQRSVEYLYPIRFDAASRYVFSRRDEDLSKSRPECVLMASIEDIYLHDCR